MTAGNVAEVTNYRIAEPIVEKTIFFYRGTTAQVGQASSLLRIYDHTQTHHTR